MRKIAKKTALLLSLTALVTTSAALPFAQKSGDTQTAFAQSAQYSMQEETSLVLPENYQQYLSLTNPMDVAVCNDYMAIADNNLIYVYNVQDNAYHKYEHTVNQADPTKNNVMKLQFYEDESLYFLDGTYLYLLNPETLQISNVSLTENDPKFPCDSFLIVDDVLYYTDVKTEASVSYITLDGRKAGTLATVLGKPIIAFYNEELYYTEAGKFLYKIDPQTEAKELVAYFDDELVSMQIQNNVFVCSTLSGDFYAYNLTELALTENAGIVTPLAHCQGNYASLAPFGEYVYAVKGDSVCQYSLENSVFTDFEICETSDSKHRINSATETLLAGDTLFIADNGNSRITVYDTAADSFAEPILLDFAPNYLAGDQTTLLAADGTRATLYALEADNYGTVIATFDGFTGTVVGAVNVYGNYYLATDANYYYGISKTTDENNVETWALKEIKKTSTRYAKLLASDAYGYLYVASSNGVYRFTEEGFLSATTEGEPLGVTLPTNAEKILIDYDGGVYTLANGTLQKTTEPAPYALNEPLVYSDSATVQSFAFGIEDNVTYVLYKENYLAKTTLLDLPTVKNIPVNGVDVDIFDGNPTEVEIVRIRDRAMLIDFDLSALPNADVFPYLNYSRNETSFTTLKIGETTNGKHAILAFYDEQNNAYRACLALTADCLALTTEEQAAHYQTYPTPKTMYVSNDIPVYKFPHLLGLPTVTELTRNTAITVIGEINDLDYSYYHVQYTDSDNVTHTGYVPQPYVIGFDPTPPTPETDVYGETHSDKDGIRRLAFLLLGGAAVLILTDVLIFRAMRKKKDD